MVLGGERTVQTLGNLPTHLEDPFGACGRGEGRLGEPQPFEPLSDRCGECRRQALAREVAALTGESMTSAIEVALAERLERLRHSDDEVALRLARIEAIAADAARRWPAGGPTSSELIDELYDDDGLPA